LGKLKTNKNPKMKIYSTPLFLLLICCFSCKKQIQKDTTSSSNLQYLANGSRNKLSSTEKTSDGGFICCGASGDAISGQDGFLMKVDAKGKKEWYKNFGGINLDIFYHAIECSDGGFIAVGTTNSKGQGSVSGNKFNKDWVIKTDSKGNVLWDHSFIKSATGIASLNAVAESDDHFIYTTGFNHSNVHFMDVCLLKITLGGSLIDTAQYNDFVNYPSTAFPFPSSWVEQGNSINFAVDGSVVVSGVMSSNAGGQGILEFNTFLISANQNKLDSVYYYYPLAGKRNIFYSMKSQRNPLTKLLKTSNGFYIASSFELESGTAMTIQLVKTDFDGNIIWDKYYHGLGNSMLSSLSMMADETLVITGATSPEKYNFNFPEFFSTLKTLLLRIDKDGNIISEGYSGGENMVNYLTNFQTLPDKSLLGIGFSTTSTEGFDKVFSIKLTNKGEFLNN
jgi:hypothetical protein